MKPSTLLLFIFSLLLLLMAISTGAQQSNTIDITTTAVPFLRIAPDARGGGMGDAGIALSADANSGFYNLAKTPFAKSKTAIGINYTPWLKEVADDIYLSTLAGFYKLDDEQALSASLRYFNVGNLSIIDYNGNKLQTTSPREYAIDLGYSRKLSARFGVAAAIRYIYSNLATGNVNGTSYKAATAVAGDVSFYYNGLNDSEQGWAAGFSLSNLGSKINYTDDAAKKDFLPANLALGVAYTEVYNEQNKISFAVDFNKSLVPKVPARAEDMPAYRDKGVVESWFSSFGNEAWQLGFGAEYGYNDQIFLRAGYNNQTYAMGNWQYLTAGAGIHFNIATVNFSYLVPTGNSTDRNPLSNTVRFGLLLGPDK